MSDRRDRPFKGKRSWGEASQYGNYYSELRDSLGDAVAPTLRSSHLFEKVLATEARFLKYYRTYATTLWLGAILALGDAMRCRAGSAQERTLLGLPLQTTKSGHFA
ncbi:MAG: hypothetical protein F6J93_07730 [Oscillatoria sp. SIO1A7]|nr:hypothetical protein [Oscillatoria sp. SIO1A7]